MTILGQQSVAELQDLIAAQDSNFTQLDLYFSTTLATDPTVAADYDALKARYQAARAQAESLISSTTFSLIPNAATPAQTQYDAILKAIKQSYPDLTITTGDLQDIVNRTQAPIAPPPQPTSKDYDLNLYQSANAATNAMPSVVKTAVATLTPGLVPLTKDQSSYKSLGNMPLWEKGLIGIAAAGLIFVVFKVVV